MHFRRYNRQTSYVFVTNCTSSSKEYYRKVDLKKMLSHIDFWKDVLNWIPEYRNSCNQQQPQFYQTWDTMGEGGDCADWFHVLPPPYLEAIPMWVFWTHVVSEKRSSLGQIIWKKGEEGKFFPSKSQTVRSWKGLWTHTHKHIDIME